MAYAPAATYRRRRTLWALALTTLGLVFLAYTRGLPYSPFSSDDSSPAAAVNERRMRVQEIHGLMRVVAQSSGFLPTDGSLTGSEEEGVDLRVYAAAAGGDEAWGDHVKRLRQESPVIVFSKTYCQFSQRAKALLETYKLVPPPTIVELDTRPDGHIIQNILARLTGRRTVPNVLLHGESIGGSDDLHALHESGELKELFTSQDVRVAGKV